MFLEDEGIKIYTGCGVKKVSSINKKISVVAVVNNKSKTITGSHLLIATGRTPNTDALQLFNTDIKTEEGGHIIVNQKLETNAER